MTGRREMVQSSKVLSTSRPRLSAPPARRPRHLFTSCVPKHANFPTLAQYTYVLPGQSKVSIRSVKRLAFHDKPSVRAAVGRARSSGAALSGARLTASKLTRNCASRAAQLGASFRPKSLLVSDHSSQSLADSCPGPGAYIGAKSLLPVGVRCGFQVSHSRDEISKHEI